jgi:diaminohydroxyphosphoribosylaminopyrimidine deaminase/5-amino-6-(5-phosphoribosylamino)uracil reductase
MKEDRESVKRALEHVCAGVFLMADDEYLDRALQLARLGRREAHPNPRVGAVVVAADEVVGEGYHRGPGTLHAEAVALEQAGERARGATLFVTLEPCCRYGRTGPCTEKIVAAGVSRVVVGAIDPNPAIDGRGIETLRAAGIQTMVVSGDLHTLCELLNEPFTRFIRQGLPFLTFKAAVSLDGKVAAAGGDARWISSPESRRWVHRMRAAADAVMVGAGTVRRDDPLLTARDADGPDPVRVVVSRSGDLSPEALVVQTARETPTILLTESIDAVAARALRSRGVEVVQAGGRHDGLAALAQRGLLEILFEGGPTLAGALLADDLIDRFVVFVAPLVVGRGAPDLVALPAPQAVADGLALSDVVWTTAGPDVVCRGRVVKRVVATVALPLSLETPEPRQESGSRPTLGAQEREG